LRYRRSGEALELRLEGNPDTGADTVGDGGICTRADTPLTRVAAAMVKNVTAVAREFARPGSR
jgi:hypothetical protein